MNQTTNYKLNLPEGRDIVDIEVLNGNFSSLDGLIKEAMEQISTVDDSLDSTNSSLQSSINSVDNNRKPVVGTYTGNDEASRNITLNFQPSLVIIAHHVGFASLYYNGIASPSFPVYNNYGNLLTVTSNGFTVYYQEGNRQLTNVHGIKYIYAAWR